MDKMIQDGDSLQAIRTSDLLVTEKKQKIKKINYKTNFLTIFAIAILLTVFMLIIYGVEVIKDLYAF